jgi:hypothetical protein
MAKSTRSSRLPILTKTVDSVPLDLPTLTEVIEEQIATLSDEQCRRLAEQLFPKLETALLEALSNSPQSDWQMAMQQVRNALPALIQNALQEPR